MQRAFLKSALIGTVASGVIAYCLVLVLAVFSQSGHLSNVGFRLGSLEIFAIWADENGHHFTIGAGILLIAAAGGVLNGLGTLALTSRRARNLRTVR